MLPAFLEEKREEIAELCRQHRVRRLSVFGSAVRADFDPERSDVDLRVELEIEDPVPYASNYFALHHALERLLARHVDLVSAPVLRNSYFLEEVEKTQELLYAA